MEDERIQRLLVLWKSGRDKYVSFFSVLDEVRRDIGNEALPTWCVNNLRIGISIIAETKNVLLKVDREIVKQNMAASEAAAKDQARKIKEDAALARELEKQERIKKAAEARVEAERVKAEALRIKTETSKARDKEKHRHKKASPIQQTERKRKALTSKVSDAELAELVKRFKKAETMCQQGVDLWIEGSIAKALILAAARSKFAADQEFSAWLDLNNINLERHDRAALIGLGRLGEARLREVLIGTHRRSYQYIWEDNRPLLQVVEN